jgi:hypothetical protein
MLCNRNWKSGPFRHGWTNKDLRGLFESGCQQHRPDHLQGNALNLQVASTLSVEYLIFLKFPSSQLNADHRKYE